MKKTNEPESDSYRAELLPQQIEELLHLKRQFNTTKLIFNSYDAGGGGGVMKGWMYILEVPPIPL